LCLLCFLWQNPGRLLQLGAVEIGLEFDFAGELLVHGLDEGEHFVGRLCADEGRDGFLAYGETDGEVSETGEGIGSGLGGAVTVLFF
jgi:hypothetical protein